MRPPSGSGMRQGFTLIELMVVVVIIGILASIGIANFMHMRVRAKESSVKENMHTLQLAAEEFATLNLGLYPSDDNDKTYETGETLKQLLPALKWPVNPFTSKLTVITFRFGLPNPEVPVDPDISKGEMDYQSDGSGNPDAQKYAIHAGDGIVGNGRNLGLILKNF